MAVIVKKYNYAPRQYALERLVPVYNAPELTEKLSYEPIWFFVDKDNNPLPPKWEVCEIVINVVHENLADADKRKHFPKYRDPDTGLSKDEWHEREKMRIESLAEDLFGSESNHVSDALHLHEGVAISNNDMLIKEN
jgi:hypothetical protein